ELERSCDPVPCPACGWYQRSMVPLVQSTQYRWLKYLALFHLIALLPALVGSSIVLSSIHTPETSTKIIWVSATIFLAVASLSLFVTRAIRCRRYDPNCEDVARRMELGRSRAMPRAEFEHWRKEHEVSQEAYEHAIQALPPTSANGPSTDITSEPSR